MFVQSSCVQLDKIIFSELYIIMTNSSIVIHGVSANDVVIPVSIDVIVLFMSELDDHSFSCTLTFV
jgi:hypothetical protein